MRETLNGATFLQLKLKNNLRERFKDIINDPLFFNQCHGLNHLLKTLVCMMKLGDTNKPRVD